MEILLIALIVAVIAWTVSKKSTERAAAVAQLAEKADEAQRRAAVAEEAVEVQRRGRLQEAAVRDQHVQLLKLGDDLDGAATDVKEASEGDGSDLREAIFKLLALTWTYQLSFVSLIYNARRTEVEFVDEQLKDPKTIVENVQVRIAKTFALVENVVAKRSDVTEDTQALLEATHTVVENTIDVLNHGSLADVREVLEHGLNALEKVFKDE